MQRFLARIESHQHDRTIIFKVIHIEYILINKVMYFNFQNMAALCDNNAEQSKFWFSRSPCSDARYPVIPCSETETVSNAHRPWWKAHLPEWQAGTERVWCGIHKLPAHFTDLPEYDPFIPYSPIGFDLTISTHFRAYSPSRNHSYIPDHIPLVWLFPPDFSTLRLCIAFHYAPILPNYRWSYYIIP